MDAPSVFPNGFHPCDITKDRGGFHRVKTIPRHKASGPIRYYFIDFGISRLYKPGDHHFVVGDDGADRDIPEMSDDEFYDPFPADVFILGNFFKRYFLPVRIVSFYNARSLLLMLASSSFKEYKNIAFLSPLVDAMTATDPADRPSAEEALKRLQSIVSSQSYLTLRHRLVGKDKTIGFKFVLYENVGILVKAALYPVKFAIGLPSQTISAVRKLVVSRNSKKAA